MTMVEERVSKLEGAYEQVDSRFADVNAQLDALRTDMNSLRADMNARLDAQQSDMNARFAEVNARLDAQQSDVNTKFNILITVIGTAGVAVAGALVAVALRI